MDKDKKCWLVCAITQASVRRSLLIVVNRLSDPLLFHGGIWQTLEGAPFQMIPQADFSEHRTCPLPAAYSPLKYQRLLRGWSQQDVVNELVNRCTAEGRPSVGLTIDAVRRWENGYNKPSPLYRKHLCTLYGLTADELGFLASKTGASMTEIPSMTRKQALDVLLDLREAYIKLLSLEQYRQQQNDVLARTREALDVLTCLVYGPHDPSRQYRLLCERCSRRYAERLIKERDKSTSILCCLPCITALRSEHQLAEGEDA